MPFSSQPDSDPPLVLPDLLAGLLEQISLEETPVEAVALTPEIMSPEEQIPDSVQSVQNMPEFLANLRSLLTAETAAEAPYAEFPPAAAEDFPLVTNELLNYLLAEMAEPPTAPEGAPGETVEDFPAGTNELLNYLLAELGEPPAPPQGFQRETVEDFPLGTNELLNYLLAEVAEPPEPAPGTFSPESVVDFERATQDLLSELLAMSSHAQLESPVDPAFQEAKRDLLDGLMASLAAEEPVIDIVAERVFEEPTIQQPLTVDQEAAFARAEPDLDDVTRGLLDDLLMNFEPEPEAVEPPPPAPPAHGLGEVPLEYVDESDKEAVDRPAGPFELLLDAIDSELGPAPRIRGTAEPVAPVRVGERYVAFDLGSRAYALPFDCILETDRIPKSTYVPGLAVHVKGVLNLRGEILPLIDLRILFGVEGTAGDGRMLVIRDTTAKAPMAFVVDRLSGLASLTPEDLARKTAADHDPAATVLRGMVVNGGRPVGLVDPERVLTAAHGDAPIHKNRFSHLSLRGRSHV